MSEFDVSERWKGFQKKEHPNRVKVKLLNSAPEWVCFPTVPKPDGQDPSDEDYVDARIIVRYSDTQINYLESAGKTIKLGQLKKEASRIHLAEGSLQGKIKLIYEDKTKIRAKCVKCGSNGTLSEFCRWQSCRSKMGEVYEQE